MAKVAVHLSTVRIRACNQYNRMWSKERRRLQNAKTETKPSPLKPNINVFSPLVSDTLISTTFRETVTLLLIVSKPLYSNTLFLPLFELSSVSSIIIRISMILPLVLPYYRRDEQPQAQRTNVPQYGLAVLNALYAACKARHVELRRLRYVFKKSFSRSLL